MHDIHATLVRNLGYRGSYSSVYRFHLHLDASHTPDVSLRMEFKPAEAAQAGFGAGPMMTDALTGEIHKTWFFVLTLAWARYQYVKFCSRPNDSDLAEMSSALP